MIHPSIAFLELVDPHGLATVAVVVEDSSDLTLRRNGSMEQKFNIKLQWMIQQIR